MISNIFKKTLSSLKIYKLPKINFSCGGSTSGGCGSGGCKSGCGRCGKGIRAIVRNEAPNFKGLAYWNGEMKKISLEDFKGKYVVLFFYPLDNTFVCPTEIVAFNDSAPSFEKINCQLISCSLDSHFSHREWANKPRDQGGLAPISIPMLADISQDISRVYGVRINGEHEDLQGVSLRGTFIIDAKGILRHSSINDLPVGRNVDEILRLVKAFQHVDQHGEVCPSKWTPGKSGMTPGDSAKLNEFWKKEHAKKH